MPLTSYPEVPERVSSLLSPGRQQYLHIPKDRTVSAASRTSHISLDTQGTGISDFLEAKIEQLNSEKEYLKSIKDGLLEAHDRGALPDTSLQEQMGTVLYKYQQQADILRVMKRNKRNLKEDLEDNVTSESSKRQRYQEPEDQGLLERAYRDSIIPRVMSAAARCPKSTFNTKAFKKAMLLFYGIPLPRENQRLSWCHILGYNIPKREVKAAHIVPKSLSKEEIAHIFGSEDDVSKDPRNSLSLYCEIELLLDTGAIAVVPVIGDSTTWKCVVLDEARYSDVVWGNSDGTEVTVKDLDGRVLKFLNENRPRRRYLYFRFLISYLNLKRFKVMTATQKIESRRFWPSGGSYIQRSTLITLARCISGCEIPEDMIEGMTFSGENVPPGSEDEFALTASSVIRNEADIARRAIITSAREMETD